MVPESASVAITFRHSGLPFVVRIQHDNLLSVLSTRPNLTKSVLMRPINQTHEMLNLHHVNAVNLPIRATLTPCFELDHRAALVLVASTSFCVPRTQPLQFVHE